VVFESDDWGSIRMSSRKVLNELINKGYSFEKCTYGSNDALETNTDLEYLLETLSSVKDSQGNPAIFTINNIVANPDFKRIKEDNFNNYYYESFVQSLKKKQDRNKVMELYKEGVQNRIFKPQFHGREHVHTDHWMEALRNGNEELREIFQRDMFTYPKGSNSSCKNEYLDSMATYGEIQHSKIEAKIKEGLDLFEKIWGFRSKTIIAPCYIWSRDIEHIFRKYGIQLIQSGRCQKEPIYNQENYEIIRRFTGQRNKYGQVYSIRNVTFEPSSNPDIDWVSKSLKEIATAFLWKKPAIISTHRVNFIGSINKKNRERNLNFLEKLLDEIISNWPEVEFMSSDDLADIILRRD
jgi:hypothetical protein